MYEKYQVRAQNNDLKMYKIKYRKGKTKKLKYWFSEARLLIQGRIYQVTPKQQTCLPFVVVVVLKGGITH